MSEANQTFIPYTENVGELIQNLNMRLSQLSDRLDEIQGHRGTPTFYAPVNLNGHRVQNVADGENDTDGVSKRQLAQLESSLSTRIDPKLDNTLIYDENGTLLHGFCAFTLGE